jgi:5-formyltetrahydrofolate cyclo-ligase
MLLARGHAGALPSRSMASTTEDERRERKAELRSVFRHRRRVLDGAERERLDAAIREHLLSAVTSTGARSVGAYVAFDGEPDILPLLPAFFELGLQLALPVLCGEEGKRRDLRFHRWTPASAMQANAFGIEEPRGTEPLTLGELDLLLLPLVAWCRDGMRLGMGAGYYDRALAALETGKPGPRRVGVAYGAQEAPALPRDSWDAPLDAVVTEDGWIDCLRAPTAPDPGAP